MTAALSHDKDVYIWGRDRPKENDDNLAILPGNDEDVTLADIGENADIDDIAVGSGHAIALTSDGRVFAVGENCIGQLGLGAKGAKFERGWKEGEEQRNGKVKKVWCGHSTSFLLVDS